MTPPNILSIAGLDPSGGAGILADTKTVSALGGYALAVATALTAQNTQGVEAIVVPKPAFIKKEIDACFKDIRIDAVKIGMLADEETTQVVVRCLKKWQPRYVVLDPVMVAKSGDRLLKVKALKTLKEELIPRVTLFTPNLPEASALLGYEVKTRAMMQKAVRDLYRLGEGNAAVYLKGGHLKGNTLTDVYFDGKEINTLTQQRIVTKNTHGTGCTLSSAIATLLPQSATLFEAVLAAKAYLTDAVRGSGQLRVGQGHGPLHHFVRFF